MATWSPTLLQCIRPILAVHAVVTSSKPSSWSLHGGRQQDSPQRQVPPGLPGCWIMPAGRVENWTLNILEGDL